MTSNERAYSLITDSLIKEYEENGAVCIRQVLTKDEIELLRKGIDENLSHPSSRPPQTRRPCSFGYGT